MCVRGKKDLCSRHEWIYPKDLRRAGPLFVLAGQASVLPPPRELLLARNTALWSRAVALGASLNLPTQYTHKPVLLRLKGVTVWQV